MRIQCGSISQRIDDEPGATIHSYVAILPTSARLRSPTVITGSVVDQAVDPDEEVSAAVSAGVL